MRMVIALSTSWFPLADDLIEPSPRAVAKNWRMALMLGSSHHNIDDACEPEHFVIHYANDGGATHVKRDEVKGNFRKWVAVQALSLNVSHVEAVYNNQITITARRWYVHGA